MLIDRDLLIDTVNETKQFTDAGFKVDKRWATVLAVGEPWWWTPRARTSARRQAYSSSTRRKPKKMVRAAGYNSAIKTQFVIAGNSPTDLEREATILSNMIAAGGDFDIQLKKAELATDWRPNYHFNTDKHEGMAYGFFRNTFPDVDIPLFFFIKNGDPQAGHLAADGKPDADDRIALQEAARGDRLRQAFGGTEGAAALHGQEDVHAVQRRRRDALRAGPAVARQLGRLPHLQPGWRRIQRDLPVPVPRQHQEEVTARREAMSAYWSHLLEARLNRRRALAASGTTVGGALFLAACGGSESKPAGKVASSLLTKPVDTSAKAVPGGVWQTSTPADVTTLTRTSTRRAVASTSSRLSTTTLCGTTAARTAKTAALIGDAADSWEFSPDGLTLTFKLRPNLKFDPRPPTNERVMTAADVKFSFERTVSKSAYAPDWVASPQPRGAGYVAEHAGRQDGRIQAGLPVPRHAADPGAQHLPLRPAPGGRRQVRPSLRSAGTGPFMLDKWLPSQRFEFKKNPDWIEKDKKRPFLDGIQRTIIPDYAAAWRSSKPATSGTTPSSRRTCCA